MGMRCGDDPELVRRNRERLVPALGLPAPPLRWLHQVHGTGVLRFDSQDHASTARMEEAWEEPEADACVTATPGTVLAILTADCLPVLFCSRDGSEIAAAHAGWRGLAGGVLEATVQAMHAAPGELFAWLGPAAGPEKYEIGAEVREAFLAHDPNADSAFVATRENHWRVDLYRLARQRLAAVGVTRVHGGGLCTISDPSRFYSHRRDARTGRMASLIWIV